VTQADTAADRSHKKSLSMQRQGRRDTKEWFHLLHTDYCSFMPTIYGPSNFLIWRSATTIDSIFTYCFAGWNIHLPAILMFTRGTRFWPIPIYLNAYSCVFREVLHGQHFIVRYWCCSMRCRSCVLLATWWIESEPRHGSHGPFSSLLYLWTMVIFHAYVK